MLQLERTTQKPKEQIPLETQIADLQSELAKKNAQIEALEADNLSNVATLLEQDMRLMDIELQLGI